MKGSNAFFVFVYLLSLLSSCQPDVTEPYRQSLAKAAGGPGDHAWPSVAVRPEELYANDNEIAYGATLYDRHCRRCHGAGLPPMEGQGPDLRFASWETHHEFEAIVLEGLRFQQGMPSFEDVLTPLQVEFIHQYVINEALAIREASKKRDIP